MEEKTTVRVMFDAFVKGNWKTMDWTSEKSNNVWI